MPYLAYALTVLLAGFAESALRRAPVAYVALAQELGLRNAGTNQDMLNSAQAKELARAAQELTGENREQALSYAKSALDALAKDSVFSNTPGPVPHEHEARRLPSLDIFQPVSKAQTITNEKIRDMEQVLHAKINGFVPAEVRHAYTMISPRIIRFGILPTGVPVMENNAPKRDASGNVIYSKHTRIDQITSREKDIQAALGAKTIRMLKPVPGENYVGVEIPNPYESLVPLRDVLGSSEYQAAQSRSKLMFVLGPDVAGQVHFCDLAKAPHLLIAGMTGAGKSMLLNVLLASILTQATPDDVRLLMIDPKMVELKIYNGIPHLLQPVVTKADQAAPLLAKAIKEMEQRYELFSNLSVRNLEGYRKLRAERMARGDYTLPNLPAWVIIIDELADLMIVAKDKVEEDLCRLAQLARAIGIHVVIATQRPSVDVITGLIKANFPSRIAFTVASAVDSRTIIDMGGAERLLNRGDMLYLPEGKLPIRIQGAFMTDQDALSLVEYWRKDGAIGSAETWTDQDEPRDLEEDGEAEPLGEEEALIANLVSEVLPKRSTLSVSFLKEHYKIGHQRASRIIKRLEQEGVISAPEGGRNERRVLINTADPVEEGELTDANA